MSSGPRISSENSKFIFTGNSKYFEGSLVWQIKDRGSGELGGWIESEDNLAKDGDSWVWPKAMVKGDSKVGGDAHVYGGAVLGGDISGGLVCGGRVEGGVITGGTVKGGLLRGTASLGEKATVAGGIVEGGCISGYAWVEGGVISGGSICGYAWIGGGSVSGDAVMEGNVILLGGNFARGRYSSGTLGGGPWINIKRFLSETALGRFLNITGGYPSAYELDSILEAEMDLVSRIESAEVSEARVESCSVRANTTASIGEDGDDRH